MQNDQNINSGAGMSIADVAVAQRDAQRSGEADAELNQAFKNFAEENPDYYAKTFLDIHVVLDWFCG